MSATTPLSAPLVFHRDKSAGAPSEAPPETQRQPHEPGCFTVGAAWVWPDGTTAPLRSKASNRCPGCARAVAFENMTMLRQDAETNGAPGDVITLTSRDAITDAGAYRQACASFWRAFRKRWGHVEYCGFIEWTTGAGPRSGGIRRLHSHWLVKGLAQRHDRSEIQEWTSAEWSKLTGAWVVQVARLETVGGVVGYLALHHEKMEQAPPAGWAGRRLRPSSRYFSDSGRTRRDRARHWLAARASERRYAQAGVHLGRTAPGPSPALVWGRTLAQKASDELTREPGGRFDSLGKRRELDARLSSPNAPIHQPICDEDVKRWVAFDTRRRALARRDEWRRLPRHERDLLAGLRALARGQTGG